MKNRTYTMPDGRKFRPQSQRRFVVVAFNDYLDRWVPVYRTDSLDRANLRMSWRGAVIDQVDGRILYRDHEAGGVCKWVAA
jgi:uncharacterized lipoprotein YmbA